MRVLLAGITGDQQYARSLKHFYEFELRPGDGREAFGSGRGDVSRRKAGAYFEEHSEYDALLMWDMDMLGPSDLVARLDAHGLDLVSGHYFARDAKALHSIWCGYGNGRWPWPPLVNIPRSGMHRIGMTGAGCLYISRRAYLAVKHDLQDGDEPFAIAPDKRITGDKRGLGSDYRFLTLAQYLGFELWGDADVQCRHATVFWMDREVYDALAHSQAQAIGERSAALTALLLKVKGMETSTITNRVEQLNKRIQDLSLELERNEKRLKEMQPAWEQVNKNIDLLKRQRLAVKGALAEAEFYLANLPANEPVPEFLATPDPAEMLKHRLGVEGYSEAEVHAIRQGVIQAEGMKWVDDLHRRDNGPHA